MEKFRFGQYDPSKEASVFTETNNYSETKNEEDTRQQFSFPLEELREYINNHQIEKGDEVIKFRLTNDNLIQYTTDGVNWLDTASGGHQIYDRNETQLPQRTKLLFKGVDVYNNNGFTVVEGLQGKTGPQGPIGPQGQQGPKGDQGEQGIQGPQGIQGIQGEKGERGVQGNDFIINGRFDTYQALEQTYPIGNKGDAYFVGPLGTNNPVYLWCVEDNQWENVGYLQGPQGFQGPEGPQGPQGQQGPQGERGIQGPTGPQGPKGDKGEKGDTGASGEGVPVGGLKDQVLMKTTSLDYDVKWGTIDLSSKQDKLVSGTNIKTLNGDNILGEGNLEINGLITGDGELSSELGINAKTLEGKTISALVNMFYPIGSLYTTTSNSNPSDVFPNTTWVKVAEKMPIGENVYGNGLNLGLTNGINYAGLGGVISEDRPIRTARSLFGENQDTSFSSSNTNVTQSIYGLGVPTKEQLSDNPQNSGLITDSVVVNVWQRRG